MFTLDFVYPKRHPLCKTYVLMSKKKERSHKAKLIPCFKIPAKAGQNCALCIMNYALCITQSVSPYAKLMSLCLKKGAKRPSTKKHGTFT